MWGRRLFSSLPRVFLDLTIENYDSLRVIDNKTNSARLVIELRSDIAPKTSENFLRLCVGSNGKTEKGYDIGYRHTKIHRILPNFAIFGGDITAGDGTGGVSIYGDTFEDENFTLKHSERGTVSMFNFGPNTNSSQFFITLGATKWLDGRHVVFGKVVKGIKFLREMEEDAGSHSGIPRFNVVVSNSGLYDESIEPETIFVEVPRNENNFESLGQLLYDKYLEGGEVIDGIKMPLRINANKYVDEAALEEEAAKLDQEISSQYPDDELEEDEVEEQ